jgi:hypothetical protein
MTSASHLQWRTNENRAIKAFFLGAVVAAGISSIPGLAFGPFVVLAFVIALPVWVIGMTIFGVPIWIVLHRLGRRDPGVFIVACFSATSLGTATWIIVARGNPEMFVLAAILGFIGAFAGWIVQRTAYGKAPVSDVAVFSD